MMGISPFNHEAKILFHTDFYFYLDTLQKLQDNVSEEDLESLSEMACDDEVALFLSRDAKSQYNFLSLLIKSNSSWRIKELTLANYRLFPTGTAIRRKIARRNEDT